MNKFGLNCFIALSLVFFTCVQKGDNLFPALVQTINANHFVSAYEQLDSLRHINPRFRQEDTTLVFIANLINSKVKIQAGTIKNNNTTVNGDTFISFVNILDALAKLPLFKDTFAIGSFPDFSSISTDLKNSLSDSALGKSVNIINTFLANHFLDTVDLFSNISKDTATLLDYKAKILISFADNLSIADSIINSYKNAIPNKYQDAKTAMLSHDQMVKKLKTLYNGTWSKYQESSSNDYALTGMLTKHAESYTFNIDGTFNYKKNDRVYMKTISSNGNYENKGVWEFNEKDTSISIKTEKERSNHESAVTTRYGTYNNNEGTSKWEDCSSDCTKDYTLASLKEEKFRKR